MTECKEGHLEQTEGGGVVLGYIRDLWDFLLYMRGQHGLLTSFINTLARLICFCAYCEDIILLFLSGTAVASYTYLSV